MLASRRIKLLYVPAWFISDLFSLRGDKLLRIDGMPDDAKIVGVSELSFFERGEIAFQIESAEFPEVPEGRPFALFDLRACTLTPTGADDPLTFRQAVDDFARKPPEPPEDAKPLGILNSPPDVICEHDWYEMTSVGDAKRHRQAFVCKKCSLERFVPSAADIAEMHARLQSTYQQAVAEAKQHMPPQVLARLEEARANGEPVTVRGVPLSRNCTCPSQVLVTQGCQCGGK